MKLILFNTYIKVFIYNTSNSMYLLTSNLTESLDVSLARQGVEITAVVALGIPVPWVVVVGPAGFLRGDSARKPDRLKS